MSKLTGILTPPGKRSLTAFVIFSLVVLTTQNAWAAGGMVGSRQLVEATAVVAPLGLSPFLALALLGGAQYFGWFTLPDGLGGLGHPAVFGACLVFGLLLQFGRSTKITKPFAEALGTGESLLGVLAVGLMFMPALKAPVAQANLTTGILAIAVGMSSVGAMVVTRTAFDILVWLSPIPFVDAVFQIMKAVLTVALVAFAVAFPTAAMVANVVILFATLLAARWAFRAASYGMTLAWDLTFGRAAALKELPIDPVNPADFGPLSAFVVHGPGLNKRAEGLLVFEAGRFAFAVRRFGRAEKKIIVGDGQSTELSKGIMGTELRCGETRLLLPPRYHGVFDDICQRSGAADASLSNRQPTHTGVSFQPR